HLRPDWRGVPPRDPAPGDRGDRAFRRNGRRRDRPAGGHAGPQVHRLVAHRCLRAWTLHRWRPRRQACTGWNRRESPGRVTLDTRARMPYPAGHSGATPRRPGEDAMPIRFRTQDTRASTRRKLNELFELDGEERFFAPTPTLDSWFIKLNGIVRQMLADGYEFDEEPPVFGTSDTRQMTCRKLNRVAAAFEAGPVEPTEEAPANT